MHGALQVNLVNSEVPADLYTFVAKMVEKKILDDLQSEDPHTKEMATRLTGRIKRKIVKQSVMTTVYGVTLLGRIPLTYF